MGGQEKDMLAKELEVRLRVQPWLPQTSVEVPLCEKPLVSASLAAQGLCSALVEIMTLELSDSFI